MFKSILKRRFSNLPNSVPNLKEFMKATQQPSSNMQPEEDLSVLPEYLQVDRATNFGKTYFIETHGC